MTLRKLVQFSLIAVPLSVAAKVPTVVLESPGQPHVAVYSTEKQGFAIGCQAIRSVWEAVPVRKLSAAEWNAELSSLSIADLHCDQRTRKYRVSGPPAPHDAIVITRRDGSTERHYVDDAAWLKGIKGATANVNEQQLAEIAPNRGVDFHKARRATGNVPNPVPTPAPAKTCFPWNECISLSSFSPSANTYSNQCSYSVELSLDHYCNLDKKPFWRSEIRVPASGNSEFKTARSECPVLGGNTQRIVPVQACK